MKRFILGVTILLTLSGSAIGQVTKEAATHLTRQQITLQGSGVFTMKRKDSASGITYKPTSSAGVFAGYRYNINRWLGVEGDFDGFRGTQKFLTPTSSTLLKSDVYAATGSAVINIPNPLTKRIQSFASIGGGALIFNPRDAPVVTLDTRNVIAFGGGVDFPVSQHIAIRAQARNFLYKAPDFEISSLKTDKYVLTMINSVGVVFKF